MDKIIPVGGFGELPMKLLISQEDFIDVASNHPNVTIFRSKGIERYLFIIDNGAVIYTNDYPYAQNFSEFKIHITGKNEAGFESQYLYEKACELGIKTSEEYNRFIKSGIIEYAKKEKVREVIEAYGDEESNRSRLTDRYEKYAYHYLYVDYRKKNFENVARARVFRGFKLHSIHVLDCISF